MTKHPVAELSGALLDAAVAMAEGRALLYEVSGDPARCLVDGAPFDSSENWALAGPIIERERIALIPGAPDTGNWGAHLGGPLGAEILWAPTPLIAAMRAYVASRFGETVEI